MDTNIRLKEVAKVLLLLALLGGALEVVRFYSPIWDAFAVGFVCIAVIQLLGLVRRAPRWWSSMFACVGIVVTAMRLLPDANPAAFAACFIAVSTNLVTLLKGQATGE